MTTKKQRRREYDIVCRAGDGQHAVYRFMACPITPPLMATQCPVAGNHEPFEPTVVHVHRRWVLVQVRRSFKAALKWVRQQQEDRRNVIV